MVPGTLSNSWSEADAKSFLLGLFIFGKNFIKIKKFLENKGMGEILSFYYGKFFKSEEYHRWSDCRKIKGRKCIIGQKLLNGQAIMDKNIILEANFSVIFDRLETLILLREIGRAHV